jgi:ribosome-associated protein
MDLVVPPGPGVPQGLTIPAGEIVERFSRSQGPGGQLTAASRSSSTS